MLTITGINNNANSVRIYNHSSIYTKNDLLAAADFNAAPDQIVFNSCY